MRSHFLLIYMTGLFLSGHGVQVLSAQSDGFKQIYYFDEISTNFHAVRQFEDDIVVVGQHGSDASGLSGVFVVRMDTLGEIKKLRYYRDPLLTDHALLSWYGCEAVCHTPDGGLALSGSMQDRNSVFFIKLDSKLNLEFFKEYESEFQARYVHHLLELDSYYYILGIVQMNGGDINISVQKVDQSGNFMWEKTYGVPQIRETAQKGIIEDGGITILSSDFYDPNYFVFNDESVWTKIFHIDSSGQVQWSWKSDRNEDGVGITGFLKRDNFYFYASRRSEQLSHTSIWYGARIVCRDSMFNLIWRRDYSDIFSANAFHAMAFGDDGYLYAAGNIADQVTWGRVCKIDPLDGEVIWDARDTAIYLPGWGSRNWMQGITVLPGGSAVAVGLTVNTIHHNNGLILKVSKDGCIDTLCSTVSIEDLLLHQDKEVRVYPNPAYDAITFYLDVDYLPDLRVDLYDLHGRRMMHQKLSPGSNKVSIDRSRTPPGLYLWRVATGKGETLEVGKIMIAAD